MGIKILIAAAIVIAGEGQGTHTDVNEIVEVSKEEASYLTRSGRAFYLDKQDDPTKGLLTATEEDKKRIKLQAKAIAEDAAARDAAAKTAAPLTAADIASIVASAVIQAQAAAAKPATPA